MSLTITIDASACNADFDGNSGTLTWNGTYWEGEVADDGAGEKFQFRLRCCEATASDEFYLEWRCEGNNRDWNTVGLCTETVPGLTAGIIKSNSSSTCDPLNLEFDPVTQAGPCCIFPFPGITVIFSISE